MAACAGALFFLPAAAPVQAGHYFEYDDDIQGRILDADTRRPLEGVVVMAMWVTQHTRITIEPEERYYDYFETLTDANGEFTVPGKGLNIFRNMPPPKIEIYKAGYPIYNIQGLTLNPSPLYPRYVTVEWKDGRRVLLYRRLPPARRKESVPHYRRVPYSEMARARVPPDRYGLYLAELARDYRAIGFQPRPPQTGVPRLIYRTGGVHPATSQPVSPVKRK